MATSYRRVPQEEGGSSESLEAHVTRSRGERLQDKLIACKSRKETRDRDIIFQNNQNLVSHVFSVAWVILAVTVSRWTSFYSTLWSSTDANRMLLRICGAGTMAVLGMIIYLTLYLPRVKGLADSSAWSVYCPKVIPTMAAVGLASYLVFLRAMWPVWGFFAPLISGTQVMGILMVLHFIPSMGIC